MCITKEGSCQEVTMTKLYMLLQLGKFEFRKTTKGEQGNKTGSHYLRYDNWVDMHHASLMIGCCSKVAKGC